MPGYLNRPDADAASFTADGWFRTGDVARVDPAGDHRIVGRASTDLIKSGGYRIGAGEIEDALLAHPAVREAAVVGLPDDDLGQRIVAFVVADGVDADTLISLVATYGVVAQATAPGRLRRRPAAQRHGKGGQVGPSRVRSPYDGGTDDG